MGALTVDDYLNNERAGLVDIAFFNQDQDGTKVVLFPYIYTLCFFCPKHMLAPSF